MFTLFWCEVSELFHGTLLKFICASYCNVQISSQFASFSKRLSSSNSLAKGTGKISFLIIFGLVVSLSSTVLDRISSCTNLVENEAHGFLTCA